MQRFLKTSWLIFYEGFEKPESSGYEHPEARVLWHWLLLTNVEVSQNLVLIFLMKVLRNLNLLDMSIQKHIRYVASNTEVRASSCKHFMHKQPSYCVRKSESVCSDSVISEQTHEPCVVS